MRPPRGRQKLFDAALELFESQGYYSTTVHDITARAGVSKGLVYNYFRSKEELLVGLLDDATARMTAVAAPLGSASSPAESLEEFLDRYFALLKRERRFLKLQLTLLLMPELHSIVRKPQRKRAKALLALLASWFEQADAGDAKRRARVFLAALDGVALHYLSVFERYPLDSMKPELLRMGRRLCGLPEDGGTT